MTPPPAPHAAATDPNAPERYGPLSFDGIRELDSNPPRVWTVIYVTCFLAALVVLGAYPAIPFLSGGNSRGMLQWSSRADLERSVRAAEKAAPPIQARFEAASLEAAEADPELRGYAIAAASATFGQNCAGCHGREGKGNLAFPNLTDKDWLWGGTREAIEHTLHVGIRWAGSADTRQSQMPSFGRDKLLPREQIIDLVEYVRSLSGTEHKAAAAARAAPVFAESCAGCHGAEGRGNQEVGAPNLSDQTWLYGGSRQQVHDSIYNAHAGVMPAFAGRLSDDAIRKLVILVRSWDGGE